MVFGGSQEAACWHVCSAWQLPYLACKLIVRGVIYMSIGAGVVPFRAARGWASTELIPALTANRASQPSE